MRDLQIFDFFFQILLYNREKPCGRLPSGKQEGSMRQKKMLHILEMLVVCALGITLILSPRRSLDAALTILGIALLAGGVIAVGYYFFTRHKASEGQQPMFIALAGCVAVVAGLVVILAPNLLTQVFRFVAGILVAFSGILNLVKALEARKEGKKGWQILLAGHDTPGGAAGARITLGSLDFILLKK